MGQDARCDAPPRYPNRLRKAGRASSSTVIGMPACTVPRSSRDEVKKG
ncbi:hypothetical protein roselon_00268 [Roseibacterium elongatum DSM 19469]|uniref:Uncharacterized protein n=1 Tax=Roseicyclus elongatus DSM 19469 TaxID=1294273 RepID=W8RNY8_9RHOB|nr:hypothetical protein roselon_00268 [Roseibacterium elongatum DSM 19469]